MSDRERIGILYGVDCAELRAAIERGSQEIEPLNFRVVNCLQELIRQMDLSAPDLLIINIDLPRVASDLPVIKSLAKRYTACSKVLICESHEQSSITKELNGSVDDYLIQDRQQIDTLFTRIAPRLEYSKLQQRLDQAKASLNSVIRHSSDAILIFNDQSKYLDANQAAAHMLGYSIDELKGMSFLEILDPEFATEKQNKLPDALKSEDQEGLVHLKTKKGELLIVQYLLTPNIGPGLHLTTLKDVTSERQHLRTQNLINSLYRVTSKAEDFDDCAERLIKSICDASGWDCAELWWADTTTQNLFLSTGYYEQLDPSFDKFKEVSLEMSFSTRAEENTAIKALNSGKPILYHDIYKESSFKRRPYFPAQPAYLMLVVPIMRETIGRGSLMLFKKREEESPADLQFFTAMMTSVCEVLGDELERISTKTTLNQIFEESNDLIGSINFSGKLLKANPALVETLGYTPDGQKGLKLLDLIPAEFSEKFQLLFQRATKGEKFNMVDILINSRAGEKKWIECSVIPNLKAKTIFFIGRDVTAHKQIRRDLKEANLKFKLATQTSRMGIWEWDIENDILEFDEGMNTIYGLQPGELNCYEQWFEMIHPDDREVVKRDITRTFEEGIPLDLGFRIIRPSGEIKHVRSTADIIRHSNGRPNSAVGVNWDVSEYVESEAKKERALADLGERIKEQQCLYRITAIQQEETSVEKVLQRVAEEIPPGWLYPELAEAAIEFEGSHYTTANYRDTPWQLSIENHHIGDSPLRISVAYREEVPRQQEGFFLAEELALLNTIGQQLSAGIDRLRSKQALEERETRFRNLIEHNHDAIVVQDENFELVYASPSLVRVTGYCPEEVLGTKATEFIHPADLAVRGKRLRRLIEREVQRVAYKERIRHKDGHYIWLYVVVTDQRHVPGVKGFVYNLKNIDQEERSRQELERSEAQLERAHRIARLGTWWYNAAKDELSWSKDLYHIYGFSPDNFKVSRSSFIKLVHPDDRHWFKADKLPARHRLDNRTIEFRAFRPDGTMIWLEGSSTLQQWHGEKDYLVEGVVQDITERKLTELQLEEREQRLRLFMENSPALSWIKDKEGRLMMANELFFKVTGRSKKHIGLDPAEYYSREELDETRVNDLMVLKSGKSMQFMEKVRNAQGEQRVYEVYKFPVDIEGEFYLGAFALDVTENKEYQKAIEKQNKKLKQIAWVQSHIVRAPLVRLMGLVELFRHHDLSKEDEMEVCVEIEKAAFELDQIIRDMVLTSKEIKVNRAE